MGEGGGGRGERYARVFKLPMIRFISTEFTCYDKKHVIVYMYIILRESITRTSG